MKKYTFLFITVLALVVGLFGLSHSSQPAVEQPVQPALGGVVNNSDNQFNTGVTSGTGNAGRGITTNWYGDKIATSSKQNQASWKNTTGQTQYVEAEVETDGTASSTYKVFAIATTSPLRTLYDFTNPASPNKMLINGFTIATSSTATTTTSQAIPGGSTWTVQVPDQSFVNFYVVAVDDRNCPATKLCETATSTNRGFNINWRVYTHN